MLPVQVPSQTPLNEVSFPDWIWAAGTSILKSRPNSLLDALHPRTGSLYFGVRRTADAQLWLGYRSGQTRTET